MGEMDKSFILYEPELIVDFAGEVAGKTILDALEHDDIELLSNYQTRIRRLPGKPPGRALEKRTKMDDCSNNEVRAGREVECWGGGI